MTRKQRLSIPFGAFRNTQLTRTRGHTYLSTLLTQPHRIPVVLDLGANHGSFARSVIERHGALCIAIEANRTLIPDVRAAGAQDVRAIAIGPEDGSAKLVIADNDEASSIHPSALQQAHPTSSAVDVRVTTREKLIDELQLPSFDLVKVDIEGMEIAAIASLRDDQLRRIAQISVEFHDRQGITTRREVASTTSFLRTHGFRHIRMSVKDCSDVLYAQRHLLSRWQWTIVLCIRAPAQLLLRFARRLPYHCRKI